MKYSTLLQLIKARPSQDGDGVKISRVVSPMGMTGLDPFLLLDEFKSDDAADYMGGFPEHPHRGFETITYMLEGSMLHEDHMGHQGLLSSGDVQWMTAGKGIIHSEMPQQENGLMHGFQLWINLPSKEKMQPAAYQDIKSDAIPVVNFGIGSHAKVIAGVYQHNDQNVWGVIQTHSTQMQYLDVHMKHDDIFTLQHATVLNHMIYVYDGELDISDESTHSYKVKAGNLALLTPSELIGIKASQADVKFLYLAGKEIKEPIAQHGPFVMNTKEEIFQAIKAYQDGTLTQ